MTEARQGTDWKWMVLFPAVSGLVLGAAFPPLPFGFLSYVALTPLLLSAERLRGRAAFSAGFVQGIFFYGSDSLLDRIDHAARHGRGGDLHVPVPRSVPVDVRPRSQAVRHCGDVERSLSLGRVRVFQLTGRHGVFPGWFWETRRRPICG